MQRLRGFAESRRDATHKNKLQNEQFIKLFSAISLSSSLALTRFCLRSACGSAWKWSSNTKAAQTTTTAASASTLANAAKFHEWNL